MPSGPSAAGPLHLRFEDVSQDGRLVLESLPMGLGPIWRRLLANEPGMVACYGQGIFPILSRLVLEGTEGPFSAYGKVEAQGSYRMVRVEDGRLMVEVWADLYAPIGRTHMPPFEDTRKVLAGRVFGEHVFTRPFAPPGQRRVTSFDFEGAPAVNFTRPSPPAFGSIGALPEGATPLEPAPRLDSVPILFGLLHTDGNMHVNSLAYLRLFEEAALRRFLELGRGSKVLCRHMDITYQRPCFAGQQMRVLQQAFEMNGKLGAAAVLVDDNAPAGARPHVHARLAFES